MPDPLSHSQGADPLTPGDRELAETMTHRASQPNLAEPYLQAVRQAARTGQKFMRGGLTEAVPGLRERMPTPVNAVGELFQSQAAGDALSAANAGGALVQSVVPRSARFIPEKPRVAGVTMAVSDDGLKVHLSPENMSIPEWGKAFSWGMKAYRTNYGAQPVLQIRDVRLPESMRGSGAGQQMYEHMADLAAREKRSLVSDGTVSENAANRWMALNRSGRNVVMNPDARFHRGQPYGSFITPDGSPVFRVEDQ